MDSRILVRARWDLLENTVVVEILRQRSILPRLEFALECHSSN